MGKDFKQKIGSKRLDSLIPSTEPSIVPKEAKRSVSVQSEVVRENKQKAIKQPLTTVTTFRVNTEKLGKIKALAYWDRKKIQDVFDEALAMYLEKVGDKNLSTAVEAYTEQLKS